MELNRTKYKVNSRVVIGTPTIQQDDVELLCNTALGAVTINLLEIPDNYWLTTWKLYIVDSGNLAGTNNITINAPSGHTINGASSVVINVNSGIAVIRISSNSSYLSTFSFAGATTTGHIIQDNAVDLTQRPHLNFQSPLQATDNGVNQRTDVTIADTGWIDLAGFSFITPTQRPQYRVLGGVIYFRGTLVIPLEKAGAVSPWTNSFSYAFETTVIPATGITDGVVLNSNGSMTFNQGAAVITNAAHRPSESYGTNWIIGNQRRYSEAPVGNANTVYYTAPFRLTISSTGILTLATLKDAELGSGSQQIGQSNLRYLCAKSTAGDTISDYRDVEDSAAGAATLIGRTNTATPNDPFAIGLNSQAATHPITHDAANETDVAGYVLSLNGFMAFTN